MGKTGDVVLHSTPSFPLPFDTGAYRTDPRGCVWADQDWLSDPSPKWPVKQKKTKKKTYAPDLTNNEARNSNYLLTLIVNEVLSLLMNGLYEAF